MNKAIIDWFHKYPPDLWAFGYLDGYKGYSPIMDSRDPLWPEYARGFGAGHDERRLAQGIRP